MYANAKPVINPEHQYDRQATFLRIKDLLEERARALNHIRPDQRPLKGWREPTFEDKYVYPILDDMSTQYPDSWDAEYPSSSVYQEITQPRDKNVNSNKKVVPATKYISPFGPDRKVFRGPKSMPYSAYSSSYGTYPNHAILSIGNADQGVPRWEIRAVPRDGPKYNTPIRRKVKIDENAQIKTGGATRLQQKPINPARQQALKSILKKGTTYPPELLTTKVPKVPDYNIHGHTTSEELLMVAKENSWKRQALKSVKILKQKVPVLEDMPLNNPGAPVVTWLKPAFLDYASSEMVAMPDAVMKKLKQANINDTSSTISDGTSTSAYSSHQH